MTLFWQLSNSIVLHLTIIVNCVCISGEVMQGGNKKVDWGIKGIRVRNVGHQNRSQQVLQQNVSEKWQSPKVLKLDERKYCEEGCSIHNNNVCVKFEIHYE